MLYSFSTLFLLTLVTASPISYDKQHKRDLASIIAAASSLNNSVAYLICIISRQGFLAASALGSTRPIPNCAAYDLTQPQVGVTSSPVAVNSGSSNGVVVASQPVTPVAPIVVVGTPPLAINILPPTTNTAPVVVVPVVVVPVVAPAPIVAPTPDNPVAVTTTPTTPTTPAAPIPIIVSGIVVASVEFDNSVYYMTSDGQLTLDPKLIGTFSISTPDGSCAHSTNPLLLMTTTKDPVNGSPQYIGFDNPAYIPFGQLQPLGDYRGSNAMDTNVWAVNCNNRALVVPSGILCAQGTTINFAASSACPRGATIRPVSLTFVPTTTVSFYPIVVTGTIGVSIRFDNTPYYLTGTGDLSTNSNDAVNFGVNTRDSLCSSTDNPTSLILPVPSIPTYLGFYEPQYFAFADNVPLQQYSGLSGPTTNVWHLDCASKLVSVSVAGTTICVLNNALVAVSATDCPVGYSLPVLTFIPNVGSFYN